MGILEPILSAKREVIRSLRGRALPAPPPRRAVELARKASDPLRLIAEIKLRSPSAGSLSRVLSVTERAAAYQRAGAQMVSVLCDKPHFDGEYEHLEMARWGCSLPLLCKDFVIDEVQLDVARAYGADAVLLIVRCLSESDLIHLVEGARERDLVPFVEVATEKEALLARELEAEIIGVNARDLDTLTMDADRAQRVLDSLPRTSARVHLSGLREPRDVHAVARTGVDAALIGEALMRQDDPEPLLCAFVEAATLGEPC